MITKNENNNLSRNRKRRIEQEIKMDDKMKSLLKKITPEKKKKIKIIKVLINLKNKRLNWLKEKMIKIPINYNLN